MRRKQVYPGGLIKKSNKMRLLYILMQTVPA